MNTTIEDALEQIEFENVEPEKARVMKAVIADLVRTSEQSVVGIGYSLSASPMALVNAALVAALVHGRDISTGKMMVELGSQLMGTPIDVTIVREDKPAADPCPIAAVGGKGCERPDCTCQDQPGESGEHLEGGVK